MRVKVSSDRQTRWVKELLIEKINNSGLTLAEKKEEIVEPPKEKSKTSKSSKSSSSKKENTTVKLLLHLQSQAVSVLCLLTY